MELIHISGIVVFWCISPGCIDEQSIESFHQIIKRMWLRYCKVRGINGLKYMMEGVMALTKPGNKVIKNKKFSRQKKSKKTSKEIMSVEQ